MPELNPVQCPAAHPSVAFARHSVSPSDWSRSSHQLPSHTSATFGSAGSMWPCLPERTGAVALINGDLLASGTVRDKARGTRPSFESRDPDAPGRSSEDRRQIPRQHRDGHLLQRAAVRSSTVRRNKTAASPRCGRRFPSGGVKPRCRPDMGGPSTVERWTLIVAHPPHADSGRVFCLRKPTIPCSVTSTTTHVPHASPGHHWLRMKTWTRPHPRGSSRLPSAGPSIRTISRDGMASVIELPGSRLLCTLETVEPCQFSPA